MEHGMFLTSMAFGVGPDTLALLHDVDWAAFEPDPSAAQLDELRNRLVAEMAGYPQSAQDEIGRTGWAEAMATPPINMRMPRNTTFEGELQIANEGYTVVVMDLRWLPHVRLYVR
jgi:hypothetical protein